jgi:hypothetical protein
VILVAVGDIEGRNRRLGRVVLDVAFGGRGGGNVDGKEIERVENELSWTAL